MTFKQELEWLVKKIEEIQSHSYFNQWAELQSIRLMEWVDLLDYYETADDMIMSDLEYVVEEAICSKLGQSFDEREWFHEYFTFAKENDLDAADRETYIKWRMYDSGYTYQGVIDGLFEWQAELEEHSASLNQGWELDDPRREEARNAGRAKVEAWLRGENVQLW